ncbi:hypothetical protein GGR57DRAFT_499145 [Xylariaceae sp. FL1272]|nr:hypothetical protein GGR57DRAFT_499145 [Xylariaceae sp. FL1272]
MELDIRAPDNPNIETDQQPQRPSPWAERFGISGQLGGDPVFSRNRALQHSGYAPERTPKSNGASSMPGPLNHALEFSERGIIPGGNERRSASLFAEPEPEGPISMLEFLHEAELIKPDETTWLPFLRKVRWRDWYGTSPLTNGTAWSIDNVSVWRVLGVVLEVLNRVLLAMLDDNHPVMATLLYGYLGYWDQCDDMLSRNGDKQPGAQVLISYQCYDNYRHGANAAIRDHMEQYRGSSVQERRQRLEMILDRLTWGWADSIGIFHACTGRIEIRNEAPTRDPLIQFDIRLLRTYIEEDISVAERCRIIMELVQITAHELAHAITMKRKDEMLAIDALDYAEPYVDFGGGSEMGFWFETQVFGGANLVGLQKGPIILRFLEKFPAPDSSGSRTSADLIPGHSDFAAGKTIQEDLVPANDDSMLLSERFWRDASRPRKSDNFFHRLPLFQRSTPHQPDQELLNYVNDVAVVPRQLLPIEAAMVQRWNERQSREPAFLFLSMLCRLVQVVTVILTEWQLARAGWYQPLQDTWRASWWGNVSLRCEIVAFSRAFASQDLGRCITIANELADYANWHTGDLQQYHLDLRMSNLPCHLVGLLMLAAIPVSHDMVRAPDLENHPGHVEIRLDPSREMQRWGDRPADLRDFVVVPADPHRYKEWPRSRLFDVQTGHPVEPLWSQLAYLERIHHILHIHSDPLAGPLLVPTGWVREILRVHTELQEYWSQKIVPTPQGMQMEAINILQWAPTWAPSWTFAVPDYDPFSLSQYDAASRTWTAALYAA